MQSDYIEHHGILGQRWGVRRFQNKDGSLKPAGEKRYYEDAKSARKDSKTTSSSTETETKKKGLSDKQKKAIKIGAAAVGTALAAYGGYKLYQSVSNNKVKPMSTEQLKSIGIKTVEPERIKVDTIKIDKTPVSTQQPKSDNNFKPKLEFNSGSSSVSKASSSVTNQKSSINWQVKGQSTFEKASQANDDLINDLLKKNGAALFNY